MFRTEKICVKSARVIYPVKNGAPAWNLETVNQQEHLQSGFSRAVEPYSIVMRFTSMINLILSFCHCIIL